MVDQIKINKKLDLFNDQVAVFLNLSCEIISNLNKERFPWKSRFIVHQRKQKKVVWVPLSFHYCPFGSVKVRNKNYSDSFILTPLGPFTSVRAIFKSKINWKVKKVMPKNKNKAFISLVNILERKNHFNKFFKNSKKKWPSL